MAPSAQIPSTSFSRGLKNHVSHALGLLRRFASAALFSPRKEEERCDCKTAKRPQGPRRDAVVLLV